VKILGVIYKADFMLQGSEALKMNGNREKKKEGGFFPTTFLGAE